MEYEVTKKTPSFNEVLDVIAPLPQPILFVIIKREYDIVKEYAYQGIANEIESKVPVMCRCATVCAAETMIQKGKNVILTINDDRPGAVHSILSELSRETHSRGGSLVGIRARSALHSTSSTLGCDIEPHPPTCDCFIVVPC